MFDPNYWVEDYEKLPKDSPIRKEVSAGRQCPGCLGKKIKYLGDTPDGMHSNSAYDCLLCPAKWEGD